jgi:hypothetical protein
MLYQNVKKVYGPYLRKDKRQVVLVYFADGSRLTVSYPKYVMQEHLGKLLPVGSDVHHRDGNPLNNAISNLMLCDKVEHVKSHAKRRNAIQCRCPICGKAFSATRGQLTDVNVRKMAGPFCSRSCVGKYGSSVQRGLMRRLDSRELPVTYWVDHL